MDTYVLELEKIATSRSDFKFDSALQQGLIIQDLLNKEQSFVTRLHAVAESATVRTRTSGTQEPKGKSIPYYPKEEVWTAAGDKDETNPPQMNPSRDSFRNTGSEDSLSLGEEDDEENLTRATMRDEIVTEESVGTTDKPFDGDEPPMTLFADLIPEEHNQYVSTIDIILRDSNLQTVSAKAVREAMSTQLGKDISSQKAAINQLILERFARISAAATLTAVDDTISKDAELAHYSFSSREIADSEPDFDPFAPSTSKDPIDRMRSLMHETLEWQSPQLQSPIVSLENIEMKPTEALKPLGEAPALQSTLEANINTIYEEKALLLSQVSQLQSDLEGCEKRAIEMQMEMEAKLTASYIKAEEEQSRLLMAHTDATRASQARLVEADHAFARMYIEKLDLEKTIEDLRAQFQEHDDSLVHGFESLIETIQSEHAEEVAMLKERIRKLNTRKFESDLSAERVLIEDLEEE